MERCRVGPEREVLLADARGPAATRTGTSELEPPLNGGAACPRPDVNKGAPMRLIRILRQRIRSLFRSEQADRELDNELAFHLEQLTRENEASGMNAVEAR